MTMSCFLLFLSFLKLQTDQAPPKQARQNSGAIDKLSVLKPRVRIEACIKIGWVNPQAKNQFPLNLNNLGFICTAGIKSIVSS